MTRDEFLSRFKRKPVECGQNGSAFHLLPLSKFDIRDILARPDWAEQVSLAIVRSAADESGARLFTDEDAATIGASISADGQDEIYKEIVRINRFGADSGKAHSPETQS